MFTLQCLFTHWRDDRDDLCWEQSLNICFDLKKWKFSQDVLQHLLLWGFGGDSQSTAANETHTQTASGRRIFLQTAIEFISDVTQHRNIATQIVTCSYFNPLTHSVWGTLCDQEQRRAKLNPKNQSHFCFHVVYSNKKHRYWVSTGWLILQRQTRNQQFKWEDYQSGNISINAENKR